MSVNWGLLVDDVRLRASKTELGGLGLILRYAAGIMLADYLRGEKLMLEILLRNSGAVLGTAPH